MSSLPIRVIAALFVLSLPYMALFAWLFRVKSLQSVAAFLASIGLLMFLVAIVAQTWRRFLLLQFPILLLSAVFAAYTVIYGNPPGQFIAFVLATSSWEDIRGFFNIWQGVRLLVATAALGLAYLFLAIWSPARPISSGRNVLVRWAIIGSVVLMSAYAAQNPAAFIDGIAANPPVGAVIFAIGPLRHATKLVSGTAVHKIPYGASLVGAKEIHILIIGESARRDSWSIYGYQRNTTPYLDKLANEAIFFRHAVSDANYTARAVPILLTGMNPTHFNMTSISGNLVDLAKEAGYSTAWLMNQDPHVSLLVGVHADRMVYPPSISTVAAGHLPLDETLLPDLNREIKQTGVARFIGLHLIGSHWEYDTRYPATFDRFGSPERFGYTSVLSHKSDERIVDAYDNSVVYTDWFLSQIIEKARKLSGPITISYFSDHGEDLFALDGNAGHGTSTYTRHQFDIPAFVWVNSAYCAAHRDKVQAMMQNADKEIRSHNVFYSIADLMGISWPGALPSESFASTDFVPDVQTPHFAGDSLVSLIQ